MPTAGETHHIALSDGVTAIGLIGVEGREQGLRSLQRNPLSAFAMKTRAGDSAYSDLEPPFTTRLQKTWDGGRGQMDLVDDSLFYDSYQVNTLVPGQAILAPAQHLILGDQGSYYVAQDMQVSVASLGNGSSGYYTAAVQWLCPADVTSISSLQFLVNKNTGQGTLRALVYADDGGSPGLPTGAALGTSADVAGGSIPAGINWITFTFSTPCAVTPGTKYWLAVYDASGEATGEYYGIMGSFVVNRYPRAAALRTFVGVWSNSVYAVFYRINSFAGINGQVSRFAEMGGVEYVGTDPASGAGEVYSLSISAQIATSLAGGLADGVTDMMVVNNATLYVAQGCAVATNYLRRYSAASGWANDGTALASYLCYWQDHIWRAYGVVGEKVNQVAKADPVAWGTNLTWDAAISVGDKSTAITALFVYDGKLYIAKEDGLYMISDLTDTLAVRVLLDFTTQRDVDNGRGALTWKIFAFIPILYGLERLAGTNVDDVGPNRLAGLPTGRAGRVVGLCPTVNWLFAAIDAGSGTSSVLAYNERGWHEVTRAYAANVPIRALAYLGRGAGTPGALWYGAGSYVYWLLLPDTTQNPYTYSQSDYVAQGHVITSWDDMGVAFVPKLYQDVTFLTKNCVSEIDHKYLWVYYQRDNVGDADSWTFLGRVETSPKVTLTFPTGTVGYRIRFKIEINSDGVTTPVLQALTYDAVERPAPGYAWSFTARLLYEGELLNGEYEQATPAAILAQLDAWAAQAAPISLYLPGDYEGASAPAAKSVLLQPVRVDTQEYEGGKWGKRLAISMIEV